MHLQSLEVTWHTVCLISQLYESANRIYATVRGLHELCGFPRGGGRGDLLHVSPLGHPVSLVVQLVGNRNGTEAGKISRVLGRFPVFVKCSSVNSESFAGSTFPGELFRTEQALLDEGSAGLSFGMQL